MARQQICPRLTDKKTFPLAIFFLLLCTKLSASFVRDTSRAGLSTSCLSNYTETTDDIYQENLQSLLYNLTRTKATTTLSFYNTTAGNPPYKSYGMYLCRGDTTSPLCYSCLTNLTRFVSSYEGNCTERIAFGDYCMYRYANYSFFGETDNSSSGRYTYDKIGEEISLVYNQTLSSVVEKVIRDVVYNSTNLFATTEAAVLDEDEKVYALAQCTPDIDRGNCSRCLKAAQSRMRNLRGDPKFAWARHISCHLRYDNASFFGADPPTSNLAQPLVSAFLVVTLCLFVNCLL